MLNSLRLYTAYFVKTALMPERKILATDFRKFITNPGVFHEIANFPGSERKSALRLAAGWLLNAQKATDDGGVPSYHLAEKWSASYPETTGYIIPTLIEFGKTDHRADALEISVRAADFLLGIQKQSGGWQGGRVNENKPEIVFNTGQVIRGMIKAYELTGNVKYINSAVRAGDWLCEIQHPEGFWKTHALMGQARVYDTFVDVPLLQLAEITGVKKYSQSAIRNIDWVLQEKIEANGWFNDCDNTVKRNDKPILHTIAYTMDGLIDSSQVLDHGEYLESARIGAEKLRDLFLEQGFLHGRYDRNWVGREYFLCTGGAQMAVIWLKLYRIYKDQDYLKAAEKMINLLIFIQKRHKTESSNTLGAIPGSFPIWGRYEPFAFPNWATKFFCDALMLEEEVKV